MEMEMIRVSGLVKTYGKVEALKGIDFKVNCGEFVGYLGPNGSGKTTTINIISGICRPDKGLVEILGIDALRQYENIGHYVAVVFENHGLYPKLTAGENLEYFARLKGFPIDLCRKYVDEALQAVELQERKNTLAMTFSKGMLRRLAIARALILKPKILILDEPFDGIDISSRHSLIKMFKNWIQEPEHCVFMTSHSMADIEALCNRLIILRSGKVLVSDTISSLQKKQNNNQFEIIIKKDFEPSAIKNALTNSSKILDIDRKDGIILIETQRETPFIASCLIEAGIQFDEIRVKQASLEDIYLRMVEEK